MIKDQKLSDLHTANGAVISGQLASKLAGPITPTQYAQASENQQIAQASVKSIGQIENIDGKKVSKSSGSNV